MLLHLLSVILHTTFLSHQSPETGAQIYFSFFVFQQGYECDTVVDSASLLSLLPYTFYLKHQSHISDAKLDSSNHWKWCQRERCGKAVRAKTLKTTNLHQSLQNGLKHRLFNRDAGKKLDGKPPDESSTKQEEGLCVACTCRSVWCFDCEDEAHWPATCEQAEMYVKQVRQRGKQAVVNR